MFDVRRLRLSAALIRPAVVCVLAVIAATGGQSLAQEPPFSPSSPGQGQQPSPSFRGGVDLIQLVVSVLDDKREPVRGLTAADFTILDEGIERPVRVFTPVDVPGPGVPAGVAEWTRDVAPDVATNQVGDQPGRLVVLLMDRSIHQGPTVAAWQLARSIVEALGPNDMAAVVATNELGKPQNFTADRARLLRSIDRRTWAIGAGAAPWTPEGALEDIRCPCGLCVLETVTRIAEAVRDTTGRSKSLFFVGSGMVLQTATAPCDYQVRVARQAMLDAIDLSNLTVHSIDPKGLESIGPQTRASTSGDQVGRAEGVSAAMRRAQHQAETSGTLEAQGTLHVLPDLTGGRTIVNRNLPEEMVPAIFRESEAYYVLGFEAATDGRRGVPRSIDVKVARSDVSVSTRRRYLPPTPAAPDSPAPSGAPASPTSLDESMSGLLPDGVPRLTMALAAFASPTGSDGIVNVSVDAAAFVFDAESTIPLDVSVTAVDQTGRPVASARQASTIPGPRPASSGAAIHIPTHLALRPGDYEVRAAITDTTTGAVASVFSHIVVPAFASERLSLSDIVVERIAAAPEAMTMPLSSVVPITARSFTRQARVRALLQIYQGTERRNPLLPASVQVRVIDTQGVVVREATTRIAREAFRDRRADFSTTIPTETLPAGEYLLSVAATAGEQTARRALRFRVQ